jgi:DNA-binding protein HU-beta
LNLPRSIWPAAGTACNWRLATCLRRAGHRVAIPGFGIFEQRTRAARKGRNPKTGEELDIAEKKAPAFTAGAEAHVAVRLRQVLRFMQSGVRVAILSACTEHSSVCVQ